MENRDWKYWQKRMEEWNATGTEPTEDELAEMIQTDPPATSPEQKVFIQQHGAKKQKQDLALEEFMRVQRDFLQMGTITYDTAHGKHHPRELPSFHFFQNWNY